MNNKGQMQSVGLLISVGITVIVGLVLLVSIAQSVGETTSKGTVVNATINLPTPNGTQISLEGRSVSSVVLLNWTTNATILSGNYTILNDQIVDGVMTARLRINSAEFMGNATRASYTYTPTGYITSAGGRSLATIIILLTALAVGVVSITPTLRGKLFDIVGR